MSRTWAHRPSLVLGRLQVHNAAAGAAGTLRVPGREKRMCERKKEKERASERERESLGALIYGVRVYINDHFR